MLFVVLLTSLFHRSADGSCFDRAISLNKDFYNLFLPGFNPELREQLLSISYEEWMNYLFSKFYDLSDKKWKSNQTFIEINNI